MTEPGPLVALDGVSHYFGQGDLRKQILFDVSAEVRAGEIVILTGPSGSGKTTLLTLIGGLRSAQAGSLRVLGEELRAASGAVLTRVRRRIGYIFQLHNLLDGLTVRQNVLLGLHGDGHTSRRDAEARALAMLAGVGLAEHAKRRPDRLSVGQKQRVAIARALVGQPRLVLADEPTASLDKQSGRDVVDLLRQLAKEQGTAVVLVTHDNRILDVADRILHLEEGRLQGFAAAVVANTQYLLRTLAGSNRKGELLDHVRTLSAAQFARVLEQVTTEAQQVLHTLTIGTDDTFESILDQVLEAFTLKMGQLVDADRATLFLEDRDRDELWSKVAQGGGEPAREIRFPRTAGIAGHVLATGEVVNLPDAYGSPLFNPEVDRTTGYRTGSVLCVPICTRDRVPFAAMQLLNKRAAPAFDGADEQRVREFADSMGVILETWNQARVARRA